MSSIHTAISEQSIKSPTNDINELGPYLRKYGLYRTNPIELKSLNENIRKYGTYPNRTIQSDIILPP
jgi:hypothetical protein